MKDIKVLKDTTISTQNNANGADTRVTVFIGITAVICGGLLIICTVWFALWAKKAWKNLKESGAYDMLRKGEH